MAERMENENREFLVRHKVETRYGNKSIAIYKGDILEMPCDQWILSAFQGEYIPSGSSPWVSIWDRFVGKSRGEYRDGFYGTPLPIIGNDVVVSLPTEELFGQQHPLIVLHLLGNEYYHRLNDDLLILRKSYSDLLLSLKVMSENGDLGPRIGMPLLGSKLHRYGIEDALEAQKSFAEDALQTVSGLDEIIICAHTERDAEFLLEAYHYLMNDQSTISRESLQDWIVESIEGMYSKIQHQSEDFENDEVIQGMRDLITMTKRDMINLNDIAIQARSILEAWLNDYTNKSSKSTMEMMIEEITAMTGRPNRTTSYLHSLRVLGNTASHRIGAPYPLTAEDLVTIFIAILGILEISRNSKMHLAK
jgi:hypothetical protein